MFFLTYKLKNLFFKVVYVFRLIFSSRQEIVLDNNFTTITSPIFIIGCFRSGTSLLRRIMDSHSKIACPPESKFIIPIANMLRNQEYIKALSAMGFSKEYVFASTRNYIADFFSRYAQSKGKIYWADKTPDYVEIIDFLDVLFEEKAKMIFIYRHGLDVATSLFLRDFISVQNFMKNQYFPNKFVGCAAFWADQVSKMKESKIRKSGRIFELKYETLVDNTMHTLQNLFAFLEIEFEPEIINYSQFPHDTSEFEDSMVMIRKGITPSKDNYKRLPKKYIDSALAISQVRENLLSLGYEI
jgi:hypothetical protein